MLKYLSREKRKERNIEKRERRRKKNRRKIASQNILMPCQRLTDRSIKKTGEEEEKIADGDAERKGMCLLPHLIGYSDHGAWFVGVMLRVRMCQREDFILLLAMEGETMKLFWRLIEMEVICVDEVIKKQGSSFLVINQLVYSINWKYWRIM